MNERGIMVTIEEARAEFESAVMDIQGVTLVAQTEVNGRDGFLVMITHGSPSIEAAIPSPFKGFPVVIEISDEFHAQHVEPTPPSA